MADTLVSRSTTATSILTKAWERRRYVTNGEVTGERHYAEGGFATISRRKRRSSMAALNDWM